MKWPSVLLVAMFGCATLPPDGPPMPEQPIDASVEDPEPDADPTSPWRLVWKDDFDGPAGQPPSNANWRNDIGGGGWGNNELQFHTDRVENVALDGAGNLAIIARREQFAQNQYTSARINTAGKFDVAYGRIEARIQLPRGQGIWPAFWMLGNDLGQVGWPSCGEIDILEQKGQQPGVIYGTLHGPGYSGGGGLSRAHAVGGSDPSSSFRVYAVEWRPGYIAWFVDDVKYYERTASSVSEFGPWVYDHPFFIILNIAVGGDFVGPPNGSTVFPQTMLVDYVRVYEAIQ